MLNKVRSPNVNFKTLFVPVFYVYNNKIKRRPSQNKTKSFNFVKSALVNSNLVA